MSSGKERLRALLLESAEKHIDRFVAGLTNTRVIEDWEVDVIRSAIEVGDISLEEGCINIDDRKWAVWTLNREYWTHTAVYQKLLADGVATKDQIKMEQDYMDIVVFESDQPKIAIEVKVKEKEAEKLAKKIMEMSEQPDLESADRGNDPLRKTKAIIKLRPEEFWIATPGGTKKFKVVLQENGFRLE